MTNKIYGYARISTRKQDINRQIRNIESAYPQAIIRQEIFSGRRSDRPEWNKLLKVVKSGDTIIFDSVSRMSRNADDGVKAYFELLDRGISLVFLNEHYIDTDIYMENTKDRIELNGTDEDEIFKGINNYFRKLAAKQIRIAFEQAEKEVQDLSSRTKGGIETARLNGKQIGNIKGVKLNVKKAAAAKEIIRKHSKDFNGTLSDVEVIKLAGISRNSFYKYKREIIEEMHAGVEKALADIKADVLATQDPKLIKEYENAMTRQFVNGELLEEIKKLEESEK